MTTIARPTITVHTVTVGQTSLVRLACLRPDGAEIDIDLTPETARQLAGRLVGVLDPAMGWRG